MDKSLEELYEEISNLKNEIENLKAEFRKEIQAAINDHKAKDHNTKKEPFAKLKEERKKRKETDEIKNDIKGDHANCTRRAL